MIPHSQPWITGDDTEAVKKALESGQITQGALAREFELKMCARVGGADGIAVASGTSALRLALQYLRCGQGDEVVLPTYVCRHLLQAVRSVGAKPVLCDVGPDWLVEPSTVAPHVTPRTKALILPHLYGLFVDIKSFRQFGVPIVEDCAQAVGSINSSPISGDVAIFSFHPTKCLTTGEGGMLVVRDAGSVPRLRELRDDSPGGGYRHNIAPLSDLSAALGLSQLARFEQALRRRSQFAEAYARALRGSAASFEWFGRRKSMFFRFPLHTAGGLERVAEAFAGWGVTVRRGVDELLHRLLGRADSEFPEATRHFNETVSLPIYPSLTEGSFSRCVEAAQACFEQVTAP
jgi:perosamine synthetase